MAGVVAVTGWDRRAWDSEFFGVSIAQVREAALDDAALSRMVRSADEGGIDCLYWLVDAADTGTVRAAETHGFSLVDIRTTLTRSLDGVDAQWKVGPQIRPARRADAAPLAAIARASHTNTRFYADGRFRTERCDALYAAWIERSVSGELADAVWVVDVDGTPAGYLTASVKEEAASIGLVAVDAAARGRGYGRDLVRAACAWAADAGLPQIEVVTQGRSAASVRFYEHAGFETTRVQLWYHRWRPGPGGARSDVYNRS